MNSETPQYFNDAVHSMSHANIRSHITLSDIRPPRNLAPLSHAVGLEVVRSSSPDAASLDDYSSLDTYSVPDEFGDAFGRLILLHDPQEESTSPTSSPHPVMRMVAYIQADMDASVASDPLLPEVAWEWLTEELGGKEAPYFNLGGTVTTTASVRYGDIGGPPRAFQLELRASWSTEGADLSGHVQAFARILAHVAGLPPEGVTALPTIRSVPHQAS